MERNHWNNDLDLLKKISQKQSWHSFSCARVIFKYASVCRFCIRLCFMNIQAERVPSMLYHVFKSIYNSKIGISRQNNFIFSNNCKWATTYKNIEYLYGNENAAIVIRLPFSFSCAWLLMYMYFKWKTNNMLQYKKNP